MSVEHFLGGAAEGSGEAKRQPAEGKYSGYDYAAEWAGKRLQLKDQPIVPSSTDADGLEKGNQEEVAHHRKRQAAWMVEYNAQKLGIKDISGVDKPSRPKKITAKTKGIAVTETMGIKKFAQNAERIHRHLTDRATELNANAYATGASHNPLEDHPMAQQALSYANDSLAQAKFHLDEGKNYRFGTGGKDISDPDAKHHYAEAMKHISDAHGYLHNDYMDAATKGKTLNSFAVKPGEISEMKGHAERLRVLKSGDSYGTVAIGKEEKVPVGSERFDELVGKAKEMAAAPATRGGSKKPLEKLMAAKRGTKRFTKAKLREQQGTDSKAEWEKPEAPVKDPRKVSDSQNKPASGNPLSAAPLPKPGANSEAAPRKAGDIAREVIANAAPVQEKPARKKAIDNGPSGVVTRRQADGSLKQVKLKGGNK